MKKAVFLDRDGVINELILNRTTGEYEPPHDPKDLILLPHTIKFLRALQNAGFELFLVSNQPDYAKGKTSLKNLHAVHEKMNEIFHSNNICFREYFYCYHHPKGVIPDFSCTCACRKPKPFFLLTSAKYHSIVLSLSWMIGDRDSDIECGKSAGTKTILIEYPPSSKNRGKSVPDFIVSNLEEALSIILNDNNTTKDQDL